MKRNTTPRNALISGVVTAAGVAIISELSASKRVRLTVLISLITAGITAMSVDTAKTKDIERRVNAVVTTIAGQHTSDNASGSGSNIYNSGNAHGLGSGVYGTGAPNTNNSGIPSNNATGPASTGTAHTHGLNNHTHNLQSHFHDASHAHDSSHTHTYTIN